MELQCRTHNYLQEQKRDLNNSVIASCSMNSYTYIYLHIALLNQSMLNGSRVIDNLLFIFNLTECDLPFSKLRFFPLFRLSRGGFCVSNQ